MFAGTTTNLVGDVEREMEGHVAGFECKIEGFDMCEGEKGMERLKIQDLKKGNS